MVIEERERVLIQSEKERETPKCVGGYPVDIHWLSSRKRFEDIIRRLADDKTKSKSN